MTTEHLSEEAIQWYAEATGEPNPHDIISHIRACETCQARVASYQGLFTAIGQQPEASFDFDLAQAVLSRLSPAPSMQVISSETSPSDATTPSPSQPHSLRWLIPLMAVAAGAPIYIFRKDILELFDGISPMLICLAVITVLSLVVFQGIESYKKYQRKMEALNLY